MNRDFLDMLSALNEAGADYLVMQVRGVPTQCIGRVELLKNKRATGRLKDHADIEALEK